VNTALSSADAFHSTEKALDEKIKRIAIEMGLK
jgi:hypothetical protein